MSKIKIMAVISAFLMVGCASVARNGDGNLLSVPPEIPATSLTDTERWSFNRVGDTGEEAVRRGRESAETEWTRQEEEKKLVAQKTASQEESFWQKHGGRWYAGPGVGFGDFKIRAKAKKEEAALAIPGVTGSITAGNKKAFGAVLGGYWLNKNWAIEASFVPSMAASLKLDASAMVRVGRNSFTLVPIKTFREITAAEMYGISVVCSFRFENHDPLSFFLKGGLNYANLKVSARAESNNGAQMVKEEFGALFPSAGIGGRYRFSEKLSIRLDASRILIHGFSTVYGVFLEAGF